MAAASIPKNVSAGAFAFHETTSWFHGMHDLIGGEIRIVSPLSEKVRVNFEKSSRPSKWVKTPAFEGATRWHPPTITAAKAMGKYPA